MLQSSVFNGTSDKLWVLHEAYMHALFTHSGELDIVLALSLDFNVNMQSNPNKLYYETSNDYIYSIILAIISFFNRISDKLWVLHEA